jgi:hypothetical protein
MSRPKPSPRRTAQLTFYVSERLKKELMLEAWEENRTLSDYLRGLLERRGKWARTALTGPGGYDIGPPKTEARK